MIFLTDIALVVSYLIFFKKENNLLKISNKFCVIIYFFIILIKYKEPDFMQLKLC